MAAELDFTLNIVHFHTALILSRHTGTLCFTGRFFRRLLNVSRRRARANLCRAGFVLDHRRAVLDVGVQSLVQARHVGVEFFLLHGSARVTQDVHIGSLTWCSIHLLQAFYGSIIV